MARKRQIDPDYPFEEEIARLSIPARYFYILSWCHMDDTNGVLPYNIFKLKGVVFPNDNIDMAAIVEEVIQAGRLIPFEIEGKKYLWCPKLLKHQTINHPSKNKYPDPPKTLREDYRNGKVALTQSRESRVERVEKEQASPALQAALKTVSKEGLNIYSLINRFKKERGWPKDRLIPEEVLLKICEQYLKNKDKVKEAWPWFIKALELESAQYFAKKNITDHDKSRSQGIAFSIGDIILKKE